MFNQQATAPPEPSFEPSFQHNNLFDKPGGPPFSRNFVFPENKNTFKKDSNL